METATLRYFNVFGPRQDPGSPYSGVISLFVTALLAGTRPLDLRRRAADAATSPTSRTWSTRTCARSRAKGLAGQAVNVATGRRISLLELHAAIARELGTRLAPEKRAPRAGDILHSQAAIGAARKLLGYKPIVGFDEGIRRTVAWYRASAGR